MSDWVKTSNWCHQYGHRWAIVEEHRGPNDRWGSRLCPCEPKCVEEPGVRIAICTGCRREKVFSPGQLATRSEQPSLYKDRWTSPGTWNRA